MLSHVKFVGRVVVYYVAILVLWSIICGFVWSLYSVGVSLLALVPESPN
jgi:hypothetical protein